MKGKDQTGFKDVNGVLIFQEMKKVAEQYGAGSVIYHFSKPGSDIPEAKMGFVKLFEPWGWIIGTGAYVADIEADIAVMRNFAMVALVVGLAAMCVVSYFLACSVIKPVNRLKRRMQSMADGDLDTEIKGIGRRDEVGNMGRTLDVLRQSLIRHRDREAKQKELDAASQARVVQTLTSRLSMLANGDLTARIDSAFSEEYEQLRSDFNRTVDNLSATVVQVVESAASIRNGAAEISQSSDDLSH
ncbi:methyl-accepting chemotaxis protein, partial [Phaeobacter sp. QD34_3]